MKYLTGQSNNPTKTKVTSSEEIENAFRAITTDEREFVTKAELYHHLSRPMADYCMRKMKPYTDPNTNAAVPDAYDFVEFTSKIFRSQLDLSQK